jgi:hypothetical protein
MAHGSRNFFAAATLWQVAAFGTRVAPLYGEVSIPRFDRNRDNRDERSECS